MRCPDDNVLAEYVDGVLDADRRRDVEQHVDTCVACRQMVSDLARMQHAARGAVDAYGETDDVTLAVASDGLGSTTTLEAVRHRKRTSHIVPGTIIGEYEVTGVLGAGGMGIVFAAVHPRIGKRAAIKILQRDLALDHSSIVRFENEARAVNAIGHPNIVDIFSFGELSNGDPYYVMEHVDGKSLHEWIHTRGPVDLDRAMPILRQICDALSAAHERGIIHRDLKPGNIMVTGTDAAPRVKVLDFGLAKMTHHDELGDDLTHPGIALGTPAFMSPEQFMGKDVDRRTDVYALGVLVYQMLTGVYPFQGATPSAIGHQHLFHTPRMPSAIAGLSERVDHIIAKALAKDLGSRYETIAEFRSDLEQCAAEQPASPPRFASPPAQPDALTMRPAVARPDAPTMAGGRDLQPVLPTPSAIAAPRRRLWPLAAGAAAITAAAIVWMLTRGSDAPAPMPPVADEHAVPPATAPSPPSPTPSPTASADKAPVEVRDPAPAARPPPVKPAPATPAHRVVKPPHPAPKPPPDRGSGAADDDRMLLEGGEVKKSK